MSSRRPPRRLSEDDLAIWRQVAKSATPMHAVRPTASPAPTAPPTSPQGGRTQPPESLPAFTIGQAASYDRSKGHNLSPTLETRLAAQPVRMDQKTFTRMKRGKLRPNRKIDLHGMTLDRAHPALSRFIIAAHADGCRLVLVVTGKGRTHRDDDGPIPTPRGVLRNQVPQWLRMAPLGALVLQVTEAHKSHGGSGAYYVYLSRRR
ncbi:Smr/MutS family protein [Tropicimonas isoalkanivorans]|uniref:DNA-nicking endonuclease, Smr domain n=1 Tax=Tropicimonas isoalkanivorans TaxID=441112 RepID=A0A1I1M6Y1_9RHOB|nr:Smr/MutS family protein [Tropicimonas isoalkanivorans]SFC81161.1 DNA-nicking endonuclease, Smr domain [Tropicimonas isoalkanivorans]